MDVDQGLNEEPLGKEETGIEAPEFDGLVLIMARDFKGHSVFFYKLDAD